MDYLKVKLSFPASKLESKGLVKLGRLSGEELYFSLWWISLAAKFSVSVKIDFVVDMITYAKK